MKKYLVVTGGAGFIGSNLIEYLIKKTNYNILSIDNYSTGLKKNHIKSNRVKYINGETIKISKLLKNYKNQINSIFHFGEFSRIFQSFKNFDKCFFSNAVSSKTVFKYCLDNKIKLIYSATSATFGNNGKDKNLSPYAFTKSKNLELLENLKKWFGLRYEIIYLYNVYGPRQISTGPMSTVIGVFESQYNNKQSLTVVKPGTQSRRFTHVYDTVEICYKAWQQNKCRHYSISNKKSYKIIDVAKMFNTKILMVNSRPGERYASYMANMSLNNKVKKNYGKLQLKDYISSFINSR